MGPRSRRGHSLRIAGRDVSRFRHFSISLVVMKPPSEMWRMLLDPHLKPLVSTDFFVVPTVNFRILFVFVALAHPRRRVIHCNVTAHPTSEWTAQQIAQAFSWDTAPRYLLHDRDRIYGDVFRQRVRGIAIREVLMAPRSP